MLAVWLGGGASSVARQLRDVRAACQAADVCTVDGERLGRLWRAIEDFGRGGEFAVIAKVSTPPAATGELLARLSPSTPVVSHVLSGITYVFAGAAPDVAGLDGCMVLERCPAELKSPELVWGPPGADYKLMERLKQQFDPHGMFNPGRYVGGL